ncbi:MAG TPA: nucleotidyltransferase family protein [Terriglobales bacterium]|nr:nucleotidyltransferase family protein [Terriglobales bacterium]
MQATANSEFEFLCILATTNLSPERRARIANWNLASLDWPKFTSQAEHHGVLPLAARNLLEIDSAALTARLPSEIARELQLAYDANLRRNLWFASEMLRIQQHFESKQLQAIPYKGPVLAQTAYGDLTLRRFSDLDFLISSADFIRAKQALDEIGYHPSSEMTPSVERFWLRKGNERMFDGPAGKYLVELQWAILPHFYAVDSAHDRHRNDPRRNDRRANDLAVENLIARARRATVADQQVPSLSAEDNLLVLCLHAAKHLWMRLIWLTDIAQTFRSEAPAIDHAQVLARASALGIVRILGVNFWLVKNLLHEQIPTWAEETIASDRSVPTLGQELAERLAASATYNFESTEYFRRLLKLRERPTDQAKYLWRLLSTPGQSDLAAVNLPESMFPLYRVVRLARLLKRFLLTPEN